MPTLRFTLAWGFIFLAAIYDSCFAWQYRAAIASWEQNPVAAWGIVHFGLVSVFIFKFAGLLFASGVALYCHRRHLPAGRLLTLTLTAAYFTLAGAYYLQQNPGEQRLAANIVAPAHPR